MKTKRVDIDAAKSRERVGNCWDPDPLTAVFTRLTWVLKFKENPCRPFEKVTPTILLKRHVERGNDWKNKLKWSE